MQITSLVTLHGDATLPNIVVEMCFFLSLLIINELARRVSLRRCAVDSVLPSCLWIGTLVLSWFTTSITLVLFNKWVLTDWSKDGLECPVFYTTTHMITKGILASAYFSCWKQEPIPRESARVVIGFSFVGAFAALDIAASNLSLVYISASFYTFLKSSSLIFILVLAVLTCVEPPSIGVFGTVTLVSIGMALASFGEVDFDQTGFALVIGGEILASLRWILTQVLLQKERVDAMTAVLYSSPAAALSLLPFVFAMERSELKALGDPHFALTFCGLVLFPGFCSFLLLLVEVQLVKETSSLTLTVFGCLKSVSTIILCTVFFGDETTFMQWCGLLVAVTGMLAYSHNRGHLADMETVDDIRSITSSCPPEIKARAKEDREWRAGSSKSTERTPLLLPDDKHTI